jgi:hypothetical protein
MPLVKTYAFDIVKIIPEKAHRQIELGVKDFVASSYPAPGVDVYGLYQQTLETIASATYMNQGGEFWLLQVNGEVGGYVLARHVRDVDNKLTYWIGQAWVRQDLRGNPIVKECWEKIRQRARECFCSHIVVVSSRGTDAYCRFLGKRWHEYARLLKEDL